MARRFLAALAIGWCCSCAAEGEEPSAPPQTSPSDAATTDTSVRPDTRPDTRADDTSGADATAGDSATTDTSTPTAPPPIEDTSFVEDYGTPAPGMHVETLIGPAGGELAGLEGTPLARVKLVVPKGALSTSILFALDFAASAAPADATLVSPYVTVGPAGVTFAIPARLTLPWTSTTAGPQLVALAKIGASWSALLDPTGDSLSMTASMKQTSGAAIALVSYTTRVPGITSVAPSVPAAGATMFIEGTNFGLAQVYEYSTPFTSNVRVGGVVAQPLAWSDTAIAVRVPGMTSGTSVVVTTPGGAATKP